PVDLLWAAHAIALSRDIEEQMTARVQDGFRPLVVMLHMARKEAGEAVAALCDVEPDNAAEIRNLQNQVHRFRDLIRFARRIVAAGIDAEHQVGDDERDELERLIAPPGDVSDTDREAEMIRLGINPQRDAYAD
ncbi:MAG TPA: hypothetical protein VK281_10320, partial [Xanthobacteraceae bacterium]|nr:hypothetical protein [Xanthobacteraceae bacterium]